MAAHTAISFWSDGTGTTYSISAALPATYDSTAYAVTSLVAFTLIGKPKSFPQFGLKRAMQEWTPISGAVEKGSGAINYGGGSATWGDVPADAGQVILATAATDGLHKSMKITLPDGEVYFLDVIILSYELSAAAAGSPQERITEIQLCRAPVRVAAAA